MKTIEEKLARLAHAGQRYGRDGDYFIDHIEKVVANLPRDAMYIHVRVAYLHDTLEDTALTTGMMVDFVVGSDIIDAVVTLTREKGVPYPDYIREIAKHPVAKVVKIADLKANLAATPRASLRMRYGVALDVLTA